MRLQIMSEVIMLGELQMSNYFTCDMAKVKYLRVSSSFSLDIKNSLPVTYQ